MRIQRLILVMSLFLLMSGIPANAEEDWDLFYEALPEQVVDIPVETKGLDLRQIRIDLLKWKVRYFDCLITNLELAYRIKAYQDAKYIEIKRQLDEANRELRALIIGAPVIKPKKEDAK